MRKKWKEWKSQKHNTGYERYRLVESFTLRWWL